MNKINMLLTFLWVGSIAIAGDSSLPGNHPLSQSQAGSVLISELRCAACHRDVETSSLPERTAPDLTEVGTRVTPDYLQRFLESPFEAHPGTSMPDMLASQTESERAAIAKALTHFLVAQSKPRTVEETSGPSDRELGKSLYHSVGCVACHGPREDIAGITQTAKDVEEEEDDELAGIQKDKIKPISFSLRHIEAKYSVKSLSDFLFQPLRVRSSGRMPDMKLTPAESQAIASYLMGESAKSHVGLTPDPKLVDAGRKHFQSLNCNACHSLPGFDAAIKAPSLRSADLSGGCLSQSTDRKNQSRSPRFALDENQLSAIAAAIREEKKDESDAISLAKNLTAFGCIACHVRDDYGGVHESHNPFFQGSELNLGDDGRIPPPLTWMGAKLQPNWMKKVLFDGESVRFYMATRMPQYGSSNLQHLPALFQRLDVMTGPEMQIPSPEGRNEEERQREKVIRAAGRELLGDKGANCVACHRFNGKAANVNQGIDLLTSYERLQPQWFNRYLRKPGAFRPRTVMPTAWPDGVATYKNILDGDTDKQIEAIWYYLSLGTSAADPSGVRSVNTKLAVNDRTVIHRGRSRVAGFRGIAVGFPGKLNYALNAETGTLSAIWEGEFVGVNWSGQGSGDFHPASEPITLPQDVSFVALENAESPWPLLPVMTKEAPTNPNPLYPKNVGYQFKGYYLDAVGIPTFQYRSGTIEIEDRMVPSIEEGHKGLKRTLRFESSTSQTLWFRALVGDIQRESEQVYRRGRLRVTIPANKTQLRAVAEDSKQQELLLPLQVPQGTSSLEIHYEPLSK